MMRTAVSFLVCLVLTWDLGQTSTLAAAPRNAQKESNLEGMRLAAGLLQSLVESMNDAAEDDRRTALTALAYAVQERVDLDLAAHDPCAVVSINVWVNP